MASHERKRQKISNPLVKSTLGGEQALRGGFHGKTRKQQRRGDKVKIRKELDAY